MTITAMRLVDGARQMVLLDRSDLTVTSLDVPFPAVRAVVENRTDTDGTTDTTARHGARSVSLGMRLLEGDAAVLDELTGFLHPRSRPYLHVTDDDWPLGERRLRLRVDQQSAPYTAPLYPFARDAQVQWVAPDGVWEAAIATEFVVNADSGTLSGRTYPMSTPRTYPQTLPSGSVDHTNPGSTTQHQKVKLYGPATGPRYTNDLTGETLAFTSDLVIPAGDYVEIDTAARTAFYLSDPDASRLNFVDFAVSSWWPLSAGLNRVRYHPISGVGAGSQAVVTYFPAWL